MKGKALWKHSLHGKKAASVLLELFISKAAIYIIQCFTEHVGYLCHGLDGDSQHVLPKLVKQESQQK